MHIKHLVVIVALLAVGLLPAPAHAGGVVTVCDEAHLLAAVAGGGTVTFACSGTITLTAEIVISADTTIDGSGQNVTISGNNTVRVFTVNSGVMLNLNELTVANGWTGYSLDGGGIANWGTLNVTNSILSGNGAANGGGIENLGTLNISNSIVSENGAYNGGCGGVRNGGTLNVSNSTLSGNTAAANGGGICNCTTCTLTVSNSTFAGNHSYNGNGGGISGGTVIVSNSTFYANTAWGGGGGVSSYGGPITIVNSTFAGNGAPYGGNIYRQPSSSPVTLRNTIITNSSAGSNCLGAITDGGGNLSYPDTTCPGINADPLLGPLQGNGGPTWTMALHPGSAAIDAGIDANCAAAPVNNLDQRGVTRPQGAHCDMGAFEWVCPSFVPPNSVDADDIVAVATRWGWTTSTPGWNPLYDLNLDGTIDILDIMLVTAAWGYTCS